MKIDLRCWCGEAATRIDAVDPEVTNPEGVCPNGEPGVAACEEHSRGGWALGPRIDVQPVLVRGWRWWDPEWVAGEIGTWAVWRDAGGSTYTFPIGVGFTPEQAAVEIDRRGGGIGFGFDLGLFDDPEAAEAHANTIRGRTEEF